MLKILPLFYSLAQDPTPLDNYLLFKYPKLFRCFLLFLEFLISHSIQMYQLYSNKNWSNYVLCEQAWQLCNIDKIMDTCESVLSGMTTVDRPENNDILKLQKQCIILRKYSLLYILRVKREQFLFKLVFVHNNVI